MKSLLQIYFLRFYFFNFFISSPPNIGLTPSTQGKATVRSIPPPPPLMMIVVDKDRQCRRQRQLAPSDPSHCRLCQKLQSLTKTANTAINDNGRRRWLHPLPSPSMTAAVDEDCQYRHQRRGLALMAPSHCLLRRGQPLSTKTGLQTNVESVPSPQGKATVINTM